MARSKRTKRTKHTKRAKRAAPRRPAKPRPPKRPATKQRPTKRPPAKRPLAKQPPVRNHPVAETALLTLARTLTEAASSESSPRAATTRALAVLARAFEADAPLPRALAHARNAALRDNARALALAWSREQLRLSLGEILARAGAAGELRVGFPAEPLAWLVLAACEALADEPREAAPDRVKLLAEWLTGG